MNEQPNPVEHKIDLYEAKVAARSRVPEPGYEMIYCHESGGIVWRHELVELKGCDYNDLLEIAIDKARIGCEVHILPTLAEDHPLRSKVLLMLKKENALI